MGTKWSVRYNTNYQEYISRLRSGKTFDVGSTLTAHVAPANCPFCGVQTEQYFVLSFQTTIGQVCLTCKHCWVNSTKYSPSTTYHQQMLARAWATWMLVPPIIVYCHSLPRGKRLLTV